MLRSTYSYALSHSSADLLQKNPPADGFYMPNLSSDIFLYTPSLSSHPSQDSTAQSSSSFDALSYICSPADRSASATTFSPAALPSSAPSQSPSFVEAYRSGREEKPITRLSPSTPFQRLFDSSPGGYWQADELSVSPISRHSMFDAMLGSERDAEGEDDGEDLPPSGKIESLLAYKKAQDIPDSPQAADRASSPSSLSTLSSRSTSPFVALSSLALPSSQTSIGRAAPFSPRKPGTLSFLGSPLKICSPSPPSPSCSPYLRRSTRLQPAKRAGGRSLATDILNQLGRPQGDATRNARTSLKLSSSPVLYSDDENYDPATGPRRATRKRVRQSHQTSPAIRNKRQRVAESSPAAPATRTSSSAASLDDDGPAYPNRTFPLSLPINENFLLFYRRFPVSSVIAAEVATAHNITAPKAADGLANPPRDAFDLYTPRFVKGRGTTKVGLCPICHERVDRGGEGKKLWLSMKFSAFNYHMQYAHGISPATGRPFSPPLAFRTTVRQNPGKLEKTELMEGKCHKCKKWVAVEGIKDVPTKVREIFWWKHAATCHQGSTIEGECDVFVEDEVFEVVASLEDAEGEMDEDE
ncbi:hypothetical protein VTO73DRAFT_4203 [Trametes versicolor]